MEKKNLYIICGSILVLTIILVSSYCYLFFTNRSYLHRFYPGVLVNDVPIGEKTLDEALEELDPILQQEDEFTLLYSSNQWKIPMEDLVVYETESTLKDILKKQNEYSIFQAAKARRSLKKEPTNHHVELTFKKDIKNILLEIDTELDAEPKNAEFVITDDREVRIAPHQTGITIDIDETIDAIKSSLQQNIYTCELKYTESHPETLTSDLDALKVKELILSVETSYAGTGENRIYNIRRAASKISNYLLLPNDEFSFNNVVGAANKANGYKEALIIVNGQFVPGYGGGVCQVSSNLYYGALKNNLEIVQRRNHGRPVSYLPRGLDATIAYPGIDLRFKNNTPYGIIIDTRVTNTHLIVDFYSYKPYFPTVTFESEEKVIPYETEYKENPHMKEGEKKVAQKGAVGYKVTTYKVKNHNGETTREVISTDTYRVVNEIIEVGTKPAN